MFERRRTEDAGGAVVWSRTIDLGGAEIPRPPGRYVVRVVARLSADGRDVAPENDERMPLLGPQTYAETRGYFDSTAELGAEKRAEVAASAIGAAREVGGLDAAGFLECSAGSTALANSVGLFAGNWSLSAG